MTTAALVTLNDVGIERGNRWLVRGINLDVHEDEIVTLVGPNGSGKSTTAKVALGILPPDVGQVKKRSNLRVGYVPQKLNLDWTIPLRVHRFMQITGKVSEAASRHALAATRVEHLRDAEVRTLSGGELQRVLLARAIARKPELLVLDEPVQGVDFSGEVELYDLISEIKQELKCGVLLISHDLHVVMAATDRVICLNGHVCCQGTPSAVASNQEYVRLFGDRASPALAIYEHQHDHKHLPDGTVLHADGSVTDHCHPDDGHHHDDEAHKGHNHA